ncbi:hypothetical protein H4R99_002967 [Coemansia sp. RSA 1722]|nr:hypothetical protein H4R99_002967 [Coemansia sp. RSA 1722]
MLAGPREAPKTTNRQRDIRNVEYIQVNYPEGYNMLLVGHELIQSIRRYDGASDEIRTAISQPSSENEEAAWRKICPSAQLLRKCYEYAQSIDRIIPSILEELCSQVNENDLGRTDRNRGLARLLADLMQTAFTFDALKESIARSVIPQDVSNHMSLFYAYHNPMAKAVVDSASNFAKESHTEALVLNTVSTLAAGSFNTLKQSKADSSESEQLCVFVLVTCCVLYDWISADGINSPQSTIDIKAVTGVVSGYKLVESTSADNILQTNFKPRR